MPKFRIHTHERLQEWVAEEKGYFTAEGLDYEFSQVERPAQPVEQLTIAIEPRDPGGVLKLEWERTRAWIHINRKP